jgi:hypothetical protein
MSDVNKAIPRKIRFDYYARGFFCPTCLHGVENKSHRCNNCAQELIEAYEFDEKEGSANHEN